MYVGNRVAQILDLTLADCWKHVMSGENAADCASRGIFPSELLSHDLWWLGPLWLKLAPSEWPKSNPAVDDAQERSEEFGATLCNLTVIGEPLFPVNKFSSFNFYKQVTTWIIRLINNCKARIQGSIPEDGLVTIRQLNQAANYWYSVI